MDSMRLSGLATGLDTSSIIQQLMSLERRPIQRWEASQAKIQNRLDIFRQLNTKLSALERAADGVKGTSLNLSTFNGKKAVSGNSALFTTSAGNNAATGSFNIEVVGLAQQQKTGDGTFTATAGTFVIENLSTGVAKSVAISGGNLSTTAAEINAANAGMSATIIDDGSGNQKLVLTGNEAGVKYQVSDGDGTFDYAALLGIATTTGDDGATYQAAVQAHIRVDGVDVYSNNNTFTTALTDVTINAVAVGTSTLTVSKDTSAAVAKVKDFIDKYNDVVNFIDSQSKYDETTKKAGLLLGDSVTRGIRTQLSQLVMDRVMPDPGNADIAGYSEFATNVGIEVTREGTLKLNETKLTAALNSDPSLVYSLFSNEENSVGTGGAAKKIVIGTDGGAPGDGIAVRISGYIQSMIKTGGDYLGAGQDGGLLGAMKGMEKSIDGFDDRIEAFERRLELRERSLRAQFTAMERSVAMLRNQGSYMANQLGGMMG